MVFALTSWPAPADIGAGKRLLERFSDLGPAEAKLARAAPVSAMLQGLGGNSPYLADLVIREAAALRRILRLGPNAVVVAELAELAKIPPHAPRTQIASEVRRAKRVAAPAVAVADIGGAWTLEQITETLSTLAT
ncbi:MAG: glutamate-ammonia-ligase adenylyltransferase, partial [Acetobacteraceae bacterium]|nr:glutamate-ammonia-ligase adenylyltransferase [Acetobacteraceae bacterium]